MKWMQNLDQYVEYRINTNQIGHDYDNLNLILRANENVISKRN